MLKSNNQGLRPSRDSAGYSAGKRLPNVPLITGDQDSYSTTSRPYSNVSSSVYSQPSPKMRQNNPMLDIPRSSSIYPDDVSPPDSPRTVDGGHASSPNISPISNAGSVFRGQQVSGKRPASNIPVPKSQQSGTASYISGWRDKVGAGQSREPRKTKWDRYLGEPTSSDKGLPGSAVPGATPFDQLKPMGVTTTATGRHSPKPDSMVGSTLKKAGKKDVPSALQAKEPWRDMSGRAMIVPVPAQSPGPAVKAKILPSPAQRRAKAGLKGNGLRQQFGGRDSPAHDSSASGRSSPATVSGPSGKQTASSDLGTVPENARQAFFTQTSQDSAAASFSARKESNPLFTPDYYSSSPQETASPVPTYQSPLSQNPTGTFVETPARENTPPHHNPQGYDEDFSQSQLNHVVQGLSFHNEPSSRFSVTTYNTTIPDSPPGSPGLTKDDVYPVPTSGASILNRKRPVPTSGSGFGSKPPSRKATPSEITLGGSPTARKPVASSDRKSSNTLDRDGKMLPTAPPGAEAVDRVTLLEAKIASLQKRRGNLNTVIHELTHVVQPSSIAYDMASRQEIKRTVEGLNTENAAVAKEIHETGMKLHRAMKKRDESSSFEPTGLWVRRVTE